MLKVLKFGGSSLADAECFKKVKNIIDQDECRKVIVVSAPGKRNKQDNKITDLLYLCYAHIQYGVDYKPMLEMIKSRYQEIVDGLGIKFDLDKEFEKIEQHIIKGTDQDFIVSRGENLNAKIIATYLGWDFVDATDHIIFNYDRSVDKERTYELLKLAYNSSKSGKIVVSGFYGTMPDGKLALMSRGGSDITGALVAAALEADIYENWTDVPGILMADPSIVKDPYPIPKISYDELRELTYLGAKVLHEASVFPVREAGIPVNIRDTNNPSNPGTIIAEKFEDESEEKFYITGIAGRKNFSIIDIHHDNFGNNVNVLRDVLKVFESHSIPIEQVNSSVDSLAVLVADDNLNTKVYKLVAELEEICGEHNVTVTNDISLIAIVSRKMVLKTGISGLLFSALGRNNVNIRIISQGASELSILIGVGSSDFEKAVKVLYDEFTKRA